MSRFDIYYKVSNFDICHSWKLYYKILDKCNVFFCAYYSTRLECIILSITFYTFRMYCFVHNILDIWNVLFCIYLLIWCY